MLRLWRDRLLVSLAPDFVGAVRLRGGPRPGIVSRQSLDCDPAYGAEPWQGAVAALTSVLEPLRSTRLDVTVVLSNHFVRYAMVPFDAAVATPEEELALARFHFARIHGERTKSWDVRVSEGVRGTTRLAGAVDVSLIEAIRTCFPAKARARLASVQPYLMAAFNLWRSPIGKEDAWLLLVEPKRVCLALLCARHWTAVQSSRGEFTSSASWVELLDREQLRVEATTVPRKVFVHAPVQGKALTQEAVGDWQFQGLTPPPLEGFMPLEDGKFAMALSAR